MINTLLVIALLGLSNIKSAAQPVLTKSVYYGHSQVYGIIGKTERYLIIEFTTDSLFKLIQYETLSYDNYNFISKLTCFGNYFIKNDTSRFTYSTHTFESKSRSKKKNSFHLDTLMDDNNFHLYQSSSLIISNCSLNFTKGIIRLVKRVNYDVPISLEKQYKYFDKRLYTDKSIFRIFPKYVCPL